MASIVTMQRTHIVISQGGVDVRVLTPMLIWCSTAEARLAVIDAIGGGGDCLGELCLLCSKPSATQIEAVQKLGLHMFAHGLCGAGSYVAHSLCGAVSYVAHSLPPPPPPLLIHVWCLAACARRGVVAYVRGEGHCLPGR
jgi:hypothetical protein